MELHNIRSILDLICTSELNQCSIIVYLSPGVYNLPFAALCWFVKGLVCTSCVFGAPCWFSRDPVCMSCLFRYSEDDLKVKWGKKEMEIRKNTRSFDSSTHEILTWMFDIKETSILPEKRKKSVDQIYSLSRNRIPKFCYIFYSRTYLRIRYISLCTFWPYIWQRSNKNGSLRMQGKAVASV